AFLSSCDVAGDYLIVQPSVQLQPFAERLRPALERAVADGLTVLALPAGPIHGDGASAVLPGVRSAVPPEWPPPLVLAEAIARAQAVIAQSFHLTVVAATCGVPAHMPESWPGFKWCALEPLRD